MMKNFSFHIPDKNSNKVNHFWINNINFRTGHSLIWIVHEQRLNKFLKYERTVQKLWHEGGIHLKIINSFFSKWINWLKNHSLTTESIQIALFANETTILITLFQKKHTAIHPNRKTIPIGKKKFSTFSAKTNKTREIFNICNRRRYVTHHIFPSGPTTYNVQVGRHCTTNKLILE